MAALKYCHYAGCRVLIPLNQTYCAKHLKAKPKRLSHDVKDKEQARFYHSNKWRRTSLLVREREPLCRECVREFDKWKANGERGVQPVIKTAKSVDHIIPLRECLKKGIDPLDLNNLQPLCSFHHELKTKQGL